MKYFIFFSALFFLVPAAAFLASQSRRIQEWVFGLLIFSTAVIGKIDINFMSRSWYRAMTEGIEISFVDFFTFILILSVLFSKLRVHVRLFWPASLGLMIIFFIYCSLNVAISDPKIFGVFELSKLLRGLLTFLAVAWFIRSERDAHVLVIALSAVLIYEGILAVEQRYILGGMRSRGSMPHPNFLADYCSMIAPIVLNMVFSNIGKFYRSFLVFAWLMGCVAVILSISRMGALLIVLGSGLVLLNQLRSNFNVRSVAIVLVLATLGGGLMLRGFDKVLMRQIGMSQAVESGNGTAGRSMYYDMAFDMAKEQPLGVGLNNWSWVVSADSDKYNLNYEPYPNTYAMSLGKHAVFAHSLYALTLGETGWIGLFLLLALWCQWLFLSGRNLFERNPDFITQVGIGCFFSLVVLMVNNITECNFRSQYIFILANVLLGYIVAIKYHKVKLQKNGY